jgi:hypothetical protein
LSGAWYASTKCGNIHTLYRGRDIVFTSNLIKQNRKENIHSNHRFADEKSCRVAASMLTNIKSSGNAKILWIHSGEVCPEWPSLFSNGGLIPKN